MKNYIIPENVLHSIIVHIAHSVPRHATTEECVQLIEKLKNLPEHQQLPIQEEAKAHETK
jgi:hypothetical protein